LPVQFDIAERLHQNLADNVLPLTREQRDTISLILRARNQA